MKEKIIKLLASGLGIGFIPGAPGSYATAVSAVVYWYFLPENALWYSLILAAGLVLSIIISSRAEEVFGVKDDQRIVIDEIVGFWFAAAFLPKSIWITVACIVLFRIFDVKKFYIIRKLQNLPGGYGVVMDDVAAGVVSNVLVRLVASLSGFWLP
jgi:phosphatidylglycerophosphatase A